MDYLQDSDLVIQKHILEIIASALALAGFKTMDDDSSYVIIRHSPSDIDYEIRLTELAGSKVGNMEIKLVPNEMAVLNYADSGFKITRIINGQMVDIELTCQEVYNAFLRQQHEFHVQDIEGVLDDIGDAADKIRTDSRLMADIISAYAENRDEHGMRWHEAATDAVRTVLEEQE